MLFSAPYLALFHKMYPEMFSFSILSIVWTTAFVLRIFSLKKKKIVKRIELRDVYDGRFEFLTNKRSPKYLQYAP